MVLWRLLYDNQVLPPGYTSYWCGSGPCDDKNTLEDDDDAARSLLGDGWRIPSIEEIEELVNNCSLEVISPNGIKKVKVTGPNGHSIILPLSGYEWDDLIPNEKLFGQNENGLYLSSSISNPNGVIMLAVSADGTYDLGTISSRAAGNAIRPLSFPCF